jgi:Family of unknown function (DUF5999)
MDTGTPPSCAPNSASDRMPQARTMTCPHRPRCPDAWAIDHEAARTVVSHADQGWSLLCNGVILFEDTGQLLPGGAVIAPHLAR